ncbi:MAG: hypothetical protein ACTSQY_00740 [Candidatus Odinarchaeia archaeon]
MKKIENKCIRNNKTYKAEDCKIIVIWDVIKMMDLNIHNVKNIKIRHKKVNKKSKNWFYITDIIVNYLDNNGEKQKFNISLFNNKDKEKIKITIEEEKRGEQ